MNLTNAALANDSSVEENVSPHGESIRKFALEHGIQSMEPATRAGTCEPKPAAIKCLVYMAAGAPLLVILRTQDRVSERLVAAHLGLAKRRVALAPAAQLMALTGFPVGSIPPFGHVRPLNTVVDALLCQEYTHVEFGEQGEWIVPVEELLRVTGARTLAVSVIPTEPDVLNRPFAASSNMPAPWPGGATHVSLNDCVVAQKRKIANLLVFLNVVPLSREPPPKPGTAAYLRRLWRHPEEGVPCEVQLILGKTIERNLGREGALELFKKLRTGHVISFTGRPQVGQGHYTVKSNRPHVVDVVVDNLQITSHTDGLSTLRYEDEENEQTEETNDVSVANSASATAGLYSPNKTGTSILSNKSKKKQKSPADRIYQHSIQEEKVMVVDTLEGVLTMRSVVLAKSLKSLEMVKNSFGVVGLDAEWRPTSREEPFTPVSILQIGTPTHVFLVDVLTLLYSAENQGSSVADALSNTLADLFGDPFIYKVGFGLRYDMKRLMESYPWLSCFSSGHSIDSSAGQLRSHVDIQLLARAAADERAMSPQNYKRMGLSSLCEHVLGAGLDKEEQRSDWGCRPLSLQQIKYAAADVCCLVDMFMELTSRCPDLLSEKRLKQFESSLNISIVSGDMQDKEECWTRVKRSTRLSSSHRTQEVECHVESLLPFLGTTVHGSRDKADIVRLASIPTNGDITWWSGPCPRFSRASGVVEFLKDTFMLFVNVPSKGYPNTFIVKSSSLEEDNSKVCEMTWWPGKGQTMKHPVIQRLLRSHVYDGEAGDCPTVLLFCRPWERGAGGYVFCGRLSVASLDSSENSYGELADPLCSQLRVTWRLNDFSSVLCHSQEFLRLLDLQLLS